MKAENLTGVADKASALFNICLALGNIIAPLLGGALVDGLGTTCAEYSKKKNGENDKCIVAGEGFNKAADVMASVLMLNFIVYCLIQFVVLPDPNAEGESLTAGTLTSEQDCKACLGTVLVGETPMEKAKDFNKMTIAKSNAYRTASSMS